MAQTAQLMSRLTSSRSLRRRDSASTSKASLENNLCRVSVHCCDMLVQSINDKCEQTLY